MAKLSMKKPIQPVGGDAIPDSKGYGKIKPKRCKKGSKGKGCMKQTVPKTMKF